MTSRQSEARHSCGCKWNTSNLVGANGSARSRIRAGRDNGSLQSSRLSQRIVGYIGACECHRQGCYRDICTNSRLCEGSGSTIRQRDCIGEDNTNKGCPSNLCYCIAIVYFVLCCCTSNRKLFGRDIGSQSCRLNKTVLVGIGSGNAVSGYDNRDPIGYP